MYQPSGIVAIIVLLNLFQLHNANAAVESVDHKFSYPGKHVMYNDYAMKEGIFVYAVCDKDSSPLEKNCTVFQRVYPYDKVARSCNIVLKVKHPENVNLTSRIWVHAFGDDNAILLWGEQGSQGTFNLMTIQLNDCKTSILELQDPESSILPRQLYTHRILTYNNSFDIFIEGAKQQNQKTKTPVGMRIHLNREPEPIYNIIMHNKEDDVGFISPIATRSPDKGYVYRTVYPNDTVMMVKPDGTEKVLINHDSYRMKISANYGVITVCTKSNTDSLTTCRQYDENGELKFEVILDNEKETVYTMAHSTPNGGFLLMTTTYEQSDEESEYSKIRHYIVRYDSEGNNLGKVRLNDVYSFPELVSVWENGDDEFCVTMITSRDDFKIDANCFTENDFSV